MEGGDVFEKLFGKRPEKGYVFKRVKVIAGWCGVVVEWSAQGIGFGDIALTFGDKKIKMESNCSCRDFCDALIEVAIKQLEEEEAKTPPTEEELMFGSQSNTINSSFLKYMYDNATWEEDPC